MNGFCRIAFLLPLVISGCDSSGSGSNPFPADESIPTEPSNNPVDTPSVPPPSDNNTDTSTAGISADLSGIIRYVGTVGVDEQSDTATFTNDLATGSGGFLEYEQPYDASEYMVVPELDTCVHFINFLLVEDITEEVSSRSIDAGEVITISSPQGSYGELVISRNDTFDSVVYNAQGDGNLPQPVPSGLTIDITGGEFPAFSNVSLPDIEPLQIIPNEGAVLNPTFRWMPSDVTNSYMILVMNWSTPTNKYLASCHAIDDGEFTLPESISRYITEDSRLFAKTTARRVDNYIQQGDALLIASRFNTFTEIGF